MTKPIGKDRVAAEFETLMVQHQALLKKAIKLGDANVLSIFITSMDDERRELSCMGPRGNIVEALAEAIIEQIPPDADPADAEIIEYHAGEIIDLMESRLAHIRKTHIPMLKVVK